MKLLLSIFLTQKESLYNNSVIYLIGNMNISRGIKVASDHLILIITKMFHRNRKMMIFGAWWGNKYEDNSRYIFEYTYKNRPDLEVYWFSPNIDVINEVRGLGYPAIYSNSLKAKWIAIRARYVYFCTSPNDIGQNIRNYIGGCTLIDSWHGIPIKKIMNDDEVTRGKISGIAKCLQAIESFANPNWFVICTSKAFIPIYQSAFGKDEYHVLNLGQARNDFFYYEHKNPYRELYPGKTIIVYMPTHRHEGRQVMDMYKILDLKKIDALCKQKNAVLLIKKHYYHRDEVSIDNNEFECVKEVTSENPKTPIMLSAADILISDYSGAFPDHLLLHRPQIFFCYDLNDYLEHDREMYFEYDKIVAGPICKNNDELLNELTEILSGNDTYKELREKQLNFFYSKNNQQLVSPRQLEAILNL